MGATRTGLPVLHCQLIFFSWLTFSFFQEEQRYVTPAQVKVLNRELYSYLQTGNFSIDCVHLVSSILDSHRDGGISPASLIHQITQKLRAAVRSGERATVRAFLEEKLASKSHSRDNSIYREGHLHEPVDKRWNERQHNYINADSEKRDKEPLVESCGDWSIVPADIAVRLKSECGLSGEAMKVWWSAAKRSGEA